MPLNSQNFRLNKNLTVLPILNKIFYKVDFLYADKLNSLKVDLFITEKR